jgi:PAS domain S-box-containing protein
MDSTTTGFLEELAERTGDLVIQIDRGWRLRYVNPAVGRIMGRDPQACLGRNALALICREDRREAARRLDPLLSGDRTNARLETRIRTPGGAPTHIIWAAHALCDATGRAQGVGAIGTDISEHKNATDQLRKREELWNRLFQSSPTWILLVTLDEGRILDCSEAFCRDTGYEKSEVLGRLTVDIGLWRGRKDREDILDLIRTHERLDRYPVRLGMKNGELRDLLWSTTVLEVQGERCLLSVLVDVTELRNTENQLARINEELRERSMALAEMNSALKVLLQQREEDKRDLESRVWHNVENMIQPHLRNLRNTELSASQRAHVDVIGSRLDEITSSLGERLGQGARALSTRELEIAAHVAEGTKNKDIAEILNISVHSVESHRFSIRKKLGILGKRANLRTCLMALARHGE